MASRTPSSRAGAKSKPATSKRATSKKAIDRRARSSAQRPGPSPEVEWYLKSRGYAQPTCLPRIKTPEPRTQRGAIFDPRRVDKVIRSLKALRHTQGKWAGKPIEPVPVQVAFIIAPVFGWVRQVAGETVRIIRDAYVEMPRKGAKTTLMSALAMYLAFGDDEAGAQVILGAASKDQAKRAFSPIAAVARGSKLLRQAGVRALTNVITQDRKASYVMPVSSRGDLAHGFNVHGALIDELHVHKDPDLLEAIESGTGARSQPLVFIITTADDGKSTSVYADRRHMIEQIAKGVTKAPAMYGVVFAADDDDDPYEPQTWAKANPLYPATPSPEFMQAEADKAKTSPAKLASFKRLHLGIRSRQDKRFLDLKRWDRNEHGVDLAALAGRRAFGGIDLASVSDLTALCWAFPDTEGGYDALWHFWAPEDSIEALDAATSGNASQWVQAGWITTTPGDVTDYDFIRAQVLADVETFDVAAIGYDRWNSSQLVNDLLAEEVPMVKVGQGFAQMSGPLKEINRLVLSGTTRNPVLRHPRNPVMRWMVDNLRVATDAAGNVKPDKAKSMSKIDGVSALTNAFAVALATEPEQRSAYEDGDFVVL